MGRTDFHFHVNFYLHHCILDLSGPLCSICVENPCTKLLRTKAALGILKVVLLGVFTNVTVNIIVHITSPELFHCQMFLYLCSEKDEIS